MYIHQYVCRYTSVCLHFCIYIRPNFTMISKLGGKNSTIKLLDIVENRDIVNLKLSYQ